jgi:hypothetical protein
MSFEEEENLVAAWIKGGFAAFAKKFDTDGGHTQVVRYGEEFSRIILTGVEVELRQDLYDLKEHGCRALDVVELVWFCTSGIHFSVTDILRGVGITDEILRHVQQSLPKTAQVVNALIDPNFPGRPLDSFTKTFPRKLDQRRVKRSIEAVPDALCMLAKLLDQYTDPIIEMIEDNQFLLCLYLLLNHYGGHRSPTLSRLLTMMRRVRLTVSPDAEHVHDFDPFMITSGKKKGSKEDPFSAGSLRQQLHRFHNKFPSEVCQTHMWVTRYTSDANAERRQSGETLIEMIGQERKEATNGPERWADSLSKALKLSDEQKQKVLSIYCEEYDQTMQAFMATSPSPRTATPIFTATPAVPQGDQQIHLEKLRQIDLRTYETIRGVLDPEQKEKFDRMQQKYERLRERWVRTASRTRNCDHENRSGRLLSSSRCA